MDSGDQSPRNTEPAAVTRPNQERALADLEHQVFRRVLVGDAEGRLQGIDHEEANVRHGLGEDRGARKRLRLAADLLFDALGELQRGRNQQRLGFGAVLGLGEQVRGDECGMRPVVGDHQDFRHAGRQVGRRACRVAGA